jgi:apolipoprotein N-acyltransferase
VNARVRSAALAALAGLLLAEAFPRGDHGWLAWIGLVPLLLAVRGHAPRRAAGIGWLAGFVFFFVTLSWIPDTVSNFTTISPLVAHGLLLLMAGACAYTFGLFAWVLEWAGAAGVSRVAFAPMLWPVLEWMRTFVVAEFPWNLLGYSQVKYVPMLQAADLGGVYLISSVIVLANAALAEAVAVRRAGSGASRVALRVGLAACAPLALFAYGQARLEALDAVPYSGALRVAIVQGNVAQDQKWDEALQQSIFDRYLALTTKAIDAGAELVVWPEAALPFYIQRDTRSYQLMDLAKDRDVDLLIGAPGLEDRDGRGAKDYNQAWLLRGDGSVQGPYDKMQLVPFGEYIPLYGLFGLVDIAVESVGQMGRGGEHTIFETKELSAPLPGGAAPGRRARFAALICYEGIFPEFVREFADRGSDFLVNISNDAWYGDTAAPDQHLLMAVVRAVENRMPLVRSTNTGISAFVTDEGQVGPYTQLFHEEVVVETVLVRDVGSFYRRFGDVFLGLCGVGMLSGLARAWRERRAAGPRARARESLG